MTDDQKTRRVNACQLEVNTKLLEKQFLAEKQVTVLEHPPYSPDLAPCDFWLFPKMKSVVKGTHFESVEDIQTRVTGVLKGLKTEAFEGCFRAWWERMHKCVQFQGKYFEGETR